MPYATQSLRRHLPLSGLRLSALVAAALIGYRDADAAEEPLKLASLARPLNGRIVRWPGRTVFEPTPRSLAAMAGGRTVAAVSAAMLSRAAQVGEGAYRIPLDGGAHAELTLDPRVQQIADRTIASHRTPYAAAVMISVEDGRVLALAGRSEAEPAQTAAELCLTPWAPAASVFKIVTAAALVSAGVEPGARVCYHGGGSSVEAGNLSNHPRLDRTCNSLSFGVAKSQNAIMARLAHDHLDPAELERTAHALGFGEALAGDMAAVPSQVSVPTEELPFARVAAGFWQTSLSPLHGAWLAATIARGGVTPPLHIVNRIVDGGAGAAQAAAGVTLASASESSLPPTRRVLDERIARMVGEMMVGTTRYGTARHAFHDRRGRASLGGMAVAGKTGSLNRKEGPFLAYSWFVGYAPADHPQVAVAVLVGNGAEWHVKAAQLAREMLEGYFRQTTSPSHTLLASR